MEIKRTEWDLHSNNLLMLTYFYDVPWRDVPEFATRSQEALENQWRKIIHGYNDKGQRQPPDCNLGRVREGMPFTWHDYEVIYRGIQNVGYIARILGRRWQRVEWEYMHLPKAKGLPELGHKTTVIEEAEKIYKVLKPLTPEVLPSEEIQDRLHIIEEVLKGIQ